MTKLEFAKTATKIVVGAGVGIIVKNIISNNAQPEELTHKVAVAAGSFVLGSMIADVATRYTDVKIDEAAAWYNKNVKK